MALTLAVDFPSGDSHVDSRVTAHRAAPPADVALFTAKTSGGNCVRIVD